MPSGASPPRRGRGGAGAGRPLIVQMGLAQSGIVSSARPRAAYSAALLLSCFAPRSRMCRDIEEPYSAPFASLHQRARLEMLRKHGVGVVELTKDAA